MINSNFGRTVIGDLMKAGVVALAAFAMGLGFNLLRSNPLPWTYQTPAHTLVEEQASVAVSNATPGAPAAGSAEVRILSLEETRKMTESRAALILDARPDLFHQLGHIKGAHSLSKKNFEQDFQRMKGILDNAKKKRQPILLYCADIHCPDAGIVARYLMERGFLGIHVFEEGWAGWEAAGLPAESS